MGTLLEFSSLLVLLLSGCLSVEDDWSAEERIVGGENSTIEEFPYQVGLQQNGIQFCGAAILSPTFLLTSCLCVHVVPVQNLRVVYGATDYTEGTIVPIKTVTMHPKYYYEGHDYDAAVLELEAPLPLGPTAAVIELADTKPSAGDNVTITGWGDLDETGNYTTVLQSAQIPVVDDATCHDIYDGFQAPITDRMFCAGEGGRDSCIFDTGGPVVKDGKVVGIVSWGLGCAIEGFPAVYTYSGHPEILSFIKDTAKLN